MSIYSITAISKSRYNNLFQNHAVATTPAPTPTPTPTLAILYLPSTPSDGVFPFRAVLPRVSVRRAQPPLTGYAPQVWAFSAKAGHAKEENRQRLEGRLPPTAGSLIFRPTRRVGHDFLELQCGKTNLGQLLLRALEEKSAIKPIFDERFAEVAKGNTFQKPHHAIDIPIRHDAMGCLVAANDWQGR